MGYRAEPKTDVVIDIETLVEPVTSSEVEEYMRDYAPPSNYKDAGVILAHREKYERNAVQAIVDSKKFSFGGKRMISCAVGIIDHQEDKVANITSWASDDLSVITIGLVQYLNQFENYKLIGWNHKSFDMPEIVKSFRKTGVKPKRKPDKWDIIDLCDHPFRKEKLKHVAKSLGLEIMDVDGGSVQQLYNDGDWARIQKYNEHDVYLTGEVYLTACSFYTL